LEKLVLRYTAALTRRPADVPDELFDALRDHFSEAQLVELTAAIALENYRAAVQPRLRNGIARALGWLLLCRAGNADDNYGR
jgi:alkylhydroperoxidase family enzyme